jgi:dTDP-4-amino-4,6-dideoxygalactose transaminase
MDEILELTRQVISCGKYVLSERLALFEKQFAEYCGLKYCVGVASGTEALYLSLLALDIKNGDEVIIPAFTAIPTLSAILMTGAKPKFIDIEPATYNIDPKKIESSITSKTKAIMPVHLFGLMADMNRINGIAERNHIPIIEDAAQSHGSLYFGKKSGHFSILGCYSFYPTKNLGAIGDAGAIVTNNEALFQKLKLLRNYGQESLYKTVINGVNSRLDELQAAYLSLKLAHLDQWNQRRYELADIYKKYLPSEIVTTPVVPQNFRTNYHVYVIRAPRRDELQAFLERHDIQTNVYYPLPLHLQKSNQCYNHKPGDFPEAEKACHEVLALPMYPELPAETVVHVCDKIKEFYSFKSDYKI